MLALSRDDWTFPTYRDSMALVTRGLLPTGLLLAACVWAFRFVRSRFGASRLEATQALFVFFATAFAVLTAVGIWFRGAGMKLVWPWNA